MLTPLDILLGAKSVAARVLRNPHFWVILALSAVLLFIYQAWPWPARLFTHGFWSSFPWLSSLYFLHVNVELRLHVLGVLFFIPIIYGSLALSWPGGVFAWLLALFFLVPTIRSWPGMWDLSLVLLLLPALLVAIVTAERRWREGERRNYIERENERRAYVAQLVDTQEAERRRIAQEIHDETLQTLLVIANKLDSLAFSSASHEQSKDILWTKEKLFQSMDDLRRLSMNMRPSILDNFGLVAGVRWLVDNISQDGCCVSTRVKGEVRNLSSLAEITVFRVVQEAMTNVQRHAHAQTASVIMDFGDNEFTLRVQDNGVGFTPPERESAFTEKGKLGIIGMEQRVLAVGGRIRLESRPGWGTSLTVVFPYSESPEVVQGEEA